MGNRDRVLSMFLAGLIYYASSALHSMDGTEAFPEDLHPPVPAPVKVDSATVKIPKEEPKEYVRVERPIAKSFDVNVKNLISTGRNTFFILVPGFQLQYVGEN